MAGMCKPDVATSPIYGLFALYQQQRTVYDALDRASNTARIGSDGTKRAMWRAITQTAGMIMMQKPANEGERLVVMAIVGSWIEILTDRDSDHHDEAQIHLIDGACIAIDHLILDAAEARASIDIPIELHLLLDDMIRGCRHAAGRESEV